MSEAVSTSTVVPVGDAPTVTSVATSTPSVSAGSTVNAPRVKVGAHAKGIAMQTSSLTPTADQEASVQ